MSTTDTGTDAGRTGIVTGPARGIGLASLLPDKISHDSPYG